MNKKTIRLVLLELRTPLLLVTLRVGGAAAAFALSLLMARTMNPGEMGVAMTCLSTASLSTMLVTGSSEAGCIRFMVAYLEKNEFGKFHGMISFNRRVTGTLGFIVIATSLYLFLLTNRLGYEFSTALLLTAFTAVLLGWQRIASAHIMSLGHVVRSLAPNSFWRQVLLLLSLALWVMAGNTVSLEVVVSAMLASAIFALILQTAVNHGPIQQVESCSPDLSDCRQWTKVGLQLGITLLFVQFSRDLTLVLSSFTLSSENIAVLGIATAIVGFAKFYVVAVNQSIAPKLSKAIARGEIAEIQKKVVITNHLKFWPMIVFTAIFWLYGDELAKIFGPSYEGIAILLPILALEPLALAFFGPSGHFLSMSGHQFVMLPLSLVTLFLLAVAITIGAHLDGMRGAAFGSSVAWIFWTASLAVLARKYIGHDVTMIAATKSLILGSRN